MYSPLDFTSLSRSNMLTFTYMCRISVTSSDSDPDPVAGGPVGESVSGAIGALVDIKEGA